MTQNRDIGVRIGGGCLPARAIERQAAARVLTTTSFPTGLAGEQMLDGAKIGHNAALDNLVAACGERVACGGPPDRALRPKTERSIAYAAHGSAALSPRPAAAARARA
jgi:hypothetical protein